ncbi:phage head closure protein [Candidatus Tisiphia endosymbiont of Beris chalybata]|uniref:phage head closure protein n=1 Tax=Candidatus Tisiphia endosymbiont of Beris chalybata TaxID=3066262 RepID=UPI00312CA049
MKKSIARNFQHQVKFLENFATNELEHERWQEKFAVYAEIKPICENRFIAIEHLSFGHVMTEGYYSFKIRFIKNITTNMRILFKERYFEIKRIINILEQDKFLNIIGLEIYVS